MRIIRFLRRNVPQYQRTPSNGWVLFIIVWAVWALFAIGMAAYLYPEFPKVLNQGEHHVSSHNG